VTDFENLDNKEFGEKDLFLAPKGISSAKSSKAAQHN
jgi:hypothetical protein